ncbi:hypothetical protein SDC9_85099 [bioreactor metagenome]|uniref:Uncharacterized protein n=1 Tax=bioreactor metagenome TaxID=1076179 RepID=A0A644ZC50_9ZZZZ
MSHFDCLAGIAFSYLDVCQVVPATLLRYMEIKYFGNHCKFNWSKENLFGGYSNVFIFLWRYTNQSCRVNGIFPVGYACYGHLWIEIGQGIKPCMVTKRTLGHQGIVFVDISLNHNIAVCRNLEWLGEAIGKLHRFVPEKSCKQVFVNSIW